jgi:hypothetical protein
MMSTVDTPGCVSDPQRYEPLPGLDRLPAWLWRRTSRRARIASALALAFVVAAAIVLIPAAREAQRDREAAEARERAQRRVQTVRELQAEQRPRHGTGPADPGMAGEAAPGDARAGGPGDAERLAARAAALRTLERAIAADARVRVRAGALSGPIVRAVCDPFPVTVGAPPPQRDLARARGSYACVAVTTEIAGTRRNAAGVLGHPYRAAVAFSTGAFAFCKVAGRPDPVPDPAVTTPKACSG